MIVFGNFATLMILKSSNCKKTPAVYWVSVSEVRRCAASVQTQGGGRELEELERIGIWF